MEDGHEITCLVRSEGSEETWFLDGLGAETIAGDITIPESVALAAEGCEAIIHLVGIIFERRGASFQQIHVEGTRNALAAAARVGARRFVHMSALGTGAALASSLVDASCKVLAEMATFAEAGVSEKEEDRTEQGAGI